MTTDIRALAHIHAVRRAVASVVREWEDRLPVPFVDELQFALYEAIGEAPAVESIDAHPSRLEGERDTRHTEEESNG